MLPLFREDYPPSAASTAIQAIRTIRRRVTIHCIYTMAAICIKNYLPATVAGLLHLVAVTFSFIFDRANYVAPYIGRIVSAAIGNVV